MSRRRLSTNWYVARSYVAGAVAVILSGLIVNEIHSWKEGLFSTSVDPPVIAAITVFDLLWIGVLLLLLYGDIRWWHSFGPGIWRARTRKYCRFPSHEDPRRHLVLFLSDLNEYNSDGNGAPKKYELTRDLDHDLEELAAIGRPYWPWEQQLRAIRPHLPVLQNIYCICSVESFPQRDAFREVLNRYGLLEGRELRIVTKSGVPVSSYTSEATDNAGVDFEDYDDLASVVRKLIEHLRESGVRDPSIVVDFTGGQKVTSAVAVAETFDHDIVAQYVQTGGAKEVFSYDVIVDKTSKDVPLSN